MSTAIIWPETATGAGQRGAGAPARGRSAAALPGPGAGRAPGRQGQRGQGGQRGQRAQQRGQLRLVVDNTAAANSVGAKSAVSAAGELRAQTEPGAQRAAQLRRIAPDHPVFAPASPRLRAVPRTGMAATPQRGQVTQQRAQVAPQRGQVALQRAQVAAAGVAPAQAARVTVIDTPETVGELVSALAPSRWARSVRGAVLFTVGAILACGLGMSIGTVAGGEYSGPTLEYTVSSGESLWELAQRQDQLSAAEFVAVVQSINGLSSPEIKSGQKITIPTNPA